MKELVFVEWEDSVSCGDWFDGRDVVGPTTCKTFGWLVSENEEYISVSATISDETDGPVGFLGYVSIPQFAVVKRRTVYDVTFFEEREEVTGSSPISLEDWKTNNSPNDSAA